MLWNVCKEKKRIVVICLISWNFGFEDFIVPLHSSSGYTFFVPDCLLRQGTYMGGTHSVTGEIQIEAVQTGAFGAIVDADKWTHLWVKTK
jgi:hypothetical protein